ncbi:MAG TPA: BTAD domain-containing putative transcriptional regulator, partial [Candidatus Elarobacter sp.]|nr:BTAD domain-containing putative transcriptional regulator [Candidatus Elarobacter sp.]
LRRKLGDESLILRSDGGYRLSPAVSVDVREIDALLREPVASDRITEDRREALVAVFATAAAGIPARYEQFAWFAPHRLRLRELTIAVAGLLARDGLARRVPAEAMRYARALVALDPLDEDARRLVLDVYAVSGEWSAARRELEGYAELLREELDAEPSAELTGLVKAARERHRALTSGMAGGPESAAAPGGPRQP